MNLGYTLSFLRILKIPSLYALMKDWQASVRIHFIFAAYESGLLKSLNRPCDRKTLIEKLQVKRPELLDAILATNRDQTSVWEVDLFGRLSWDTKPNKKGGIDLSFDPEEDEHPTIAFPDGKTFSDFRECLCNISLYDTRLRTLGFYQLGVFDDCDGFHLLIRNLECLDDIHSLELVFSISNHFLRFQDNFSRETRSNE